MKIKSHSNVNNLPDSESCNPGLSSNRIYAVIGIDNNYYRIVNDDLDPVLYPKNIFDVIDSECPKSWVKETYGDGEYYIEPMEFSAPGFFEDYFDGVSKVISVYKNYLETEGIKK